MKILENEGVKWLITFLWGGKAYNKITSKIIYTILGILFIRGVDYYIITFFSAIIGIDLSNIMLPTPITIEEMIGSSIIIFLALTYNLISYYIDDNKNKENTLLKSNIKFKLLNADKDELGSPYTFRGRNYSYSGDIQNHQDYIPPEYSHPFNDLEHSSTSINRTVNSIYGGSGIIQQTANKDFYREFIKEIIKWGGAEIIYFSILNNSKILAEDVSIDISIKKSKGLNTSNNCNFQYIRPKEQSEPIGIIPNHYNSNNDGYDIYLKHDEYSALHYKWNVGDLKPKQSSEAETKLFIRLKSDSLITITIYANNLPDPLEIKYIIKPSPLEFDIYKEVGEITSIDEIDRLEEHIMDGYLERETERLIAPYLQ